MRRYNCFAFGVRVDDFALDCGCDLLWFEAVLGVWSVTFFGYRGGLVACILLLVVCFVVCLVCGAGCGSVGVLFCF